MSRWLLFIPLLVAFSPGNIPCGDKHYLKVMLNESRRLEFCISDSMAVDLPVNGTDTIVQLSEEDALFFDLYTRTADPERTFFLEIRNNKSAKRQVYPLGIITSSNFLSRVPMKGMHKRSQRSGDFNLSLFEIRNGRDTLRAGLGKIHVVFQK